MKKLGDNGSGLFGGHQKWRVVHQFQRHILFICFVSCHGIWPIGGIVSFKNQEFELQFFV